MNPKRELTRKARVVRHLLLEGALVREFHCQNYAILAFERELQAEVERI